MGKYYKRKIKIPENWVLLNDSKVQQRDKFDPRHPDTDYYVLHYFSADCDKCIKQLKSCREFIQAKRQQFPNVKYVFVGGGMNDIYLKEAVEKLKFEFPIYHDTRYLQFLTDNFIPIDNEGVYGTMLINRKNELILFGGVFDNVKAEAMYSEIVNCH